LISESVLLALERSPELIWLVRVLIRLSMESVDEEELPDEVLSLVEDEASPSGGGPGGRFASAVFWSACNCASAVFAAVVSPESRAEERVWKSFFNCLKMLSVLLVLLVE